uniref:Uncharacterized protein n=1 Tax=Melopsittacus undulatus TaxID=13146 RepID=A0A8C6IQM6_MELUD
HSSSAQYFFTRRQEKQLTAGDSVLLSCRAYGSTVPITGVRWYRQAAGGRLEWVSYISYDSSVTHFVQSVQGRANASRDNSRSESSLFLSALQPQDSARYYCATYPHTETRKAAELYKKAGDPAPGAKAVGRVSAATSMRESSGCRQGLRDHQCSSRGFLDFRSFCCLSCPSAPKESRDPYPQPVCQGPVKRPFTQQFCWFGGRFTALFRRTCRQRQGDPSAGLPTLCYLLPVTAGAHEDLTFSVKRITLY